MKKENKLIHRSMWLALGATVVSGFGVSTSALAQDEVRRLEEIVVTAQRREQSLQDIPVAVTALSPEMIKTNRIRDVMDLSGMAPNLTVRPSAGGQGIPNFSMRGISSYGVVPGSDKQVSIYLDGVYFGSPRGSIFDLPDIAQIEVLRGPQGTLFGRNATAGAINIITRNPSGEFGVEQEISVGRRDHFRARTTIDLPEWNGLSIAATYVKEERDGYIDNLGGGTVWDRTAFGRGIQVSPDKLGGKDVESLFFTAHFEPTDNFRLTYKWDYSNDESEPNPTSAGGVFPSPLVLGPEGAAFFQMLLDANPQAVLTPDGKRPRALNNAFSVMNDQQVQGHSLRAVWELEHFTLTNITGYRKAKTFTPMDLSGLGGMEFLGMGVCVICSQADYKGDQFSNELQLNYDNDFMTLTLGALYYEEDMRAGSPLGAPNAFAFTLFQPLPDGSGYFVPTEVNGMGESTSYNEAESIAAYTQMEFHLTEDLDVIAGARITRDEKSGYYSAQVGPEARRLPFKYSETKPTYSLGVNYTLSDDIFLYAKYSTAFVSGGSVAGIEFEAEEVTSWELGMKADFLDNRLRTNLALFDAVYENRQIAQAGFNVGLPEVATLVLDIGDANLNSRGAELEVTALPIDGLTLSGTAGYTDTSYSGEISAINIASSGGNVFPDSDYVPTLVPRWTGSLSAHYETAPLFGTAYIAVGVTGTWHSDITHNVNPALLRFAPQFAPVAVTKSSWVVNARASLQEIDLGHVTGEVTLWGRNLGNNDYPTYGLNSGNFIFAGNYLEPRTYGVDVVVRF